MLDQSIPNRVCADRPRVNANQDGALLDRLLPAPGEDPPQPGHTLPEQPRWQRMLTTLDRRAAVRHHEHDDETPRR